MFPNSRGSAGVFALLAAVVFLAVSLWIAFGTRDAEVEARLSAVDDGRGTDPSGSDRLALLDEAKALYSKRSIWTGSLAYPSDLRITRPPERPAGEPPGVEALSGILDGADLVLSWRPSGATAPQGFLLQRIGEDGGVLEERELAASARSYRDGPLDALDGARTYRVTALDALGKHAGAEQQRVPYRVEFAVVFLGHAPDGESRFRIVWPRPGEDATAEFRAVPGDRIGGEADDGTLWNTGWTYVGPSARRVSIERERKVPTFAPDGRVARDPETNEVIYEVRTVTVTEAEHGATVRRPGPDPEDVWLPMAKR